MAGLVVALDFATAAQAMKVVQVFRPRSVWLKIGLELFVSEGPKLVEAIKTLDFKVFLDLKLYDIPNTVGRAAAACAKLGVDMLTLHLQGGKRMCEAAREAVGRCEKPPLLVGVTALTSFALGEMPGIAQAPGDFGIFLAKEAASWGLDGVVCSGHELASIKKERPGLLCVCPGIRPLAQVTDDQRRVMTPAQAVGLGADFLVVGRPITQSSAPLAAAGAILAEMAGAAR